MLVTLLHNTLPHVHHHHHAEAPTKELSDQYHDHPHHDESGSTKNDTEHSFFSLSHLIEHHSHADHQHEFISFTEENQSFTLEEQQLIWAVLPYQPVTYLHTEKLHLHRYALYDKVTTDQPFLSSCPLRGPPALG